MKKPWIIQAILKYIEKRTEFTENATKKRNCTTFSSTFEIITYIKTVKNNKGNGPFSISYKLFKKITQ